MTDIDTAKIRAMIARDNFEFDPFVDGLALCDALDAAHANLELADSNAALADLALQTQTNYANTYQSLYARVVGERDAEEARAEAAEARIAMLEDQRNRAESAMLTAEARIARTKEVYLQSVNRETVATEMLKRLDGWLR